jgi:hypothetical protein
MQSIVCVNFKMPVAQHFFRYDSDGSLRDHDIVIFAPGLPWYERVEFSGGGSCISVEGTARLAKASAHWLSELSSALASGKTVFVILDAYKEDQAATGSTLASRSNRTYQTTIINNYSVLPLKLKLRNARGKSVVVKDAAFKGIYETISESSEYRVLIENPAVMQTIFTAKDGTAVGGVAKAQQWPGSLVLLPYFDFYGDGYTEMSDTDGEVWTAKAIRASHSLVGQIVAIDRMLKGSADLTPPPDWMAGIESPKAMDEIDGAIADIDGRIDDLRRERDEQLLRRADLSEYSHLLYESGKPLEQAIEKVLRLLGYEVETIRIGDLEIDHVIVSPDGKRMIGESEGKDSTAINISKFRQLESNIGEDFEREEVENPAKGLLFGNGFRLSPPMSRAEQFTDKSLKNVSRLGSALIRTPDLYAVAVQLLDNPQDDAFKTACRAAIEDTVGGIVEFPRPGSTAVDAR